MHRAIEAEIWGQHNEVLREPGLVVRTAVGYYGTLHEIQCSSIWKSLRLHAWLSRLPSGATYQIFDDQDEDESGDGVLLIHYWEDARHYVTAGASAPGAQIGKPGHHLE